MAARSPSTCLSLMIFVYLWPVIVKLVHKADCSEATLVELRDKGNRNSMGHQIKWRTPLAIALSVAGSGAIYQPTLR